MTCDVNLYFQFLIIVVTLCDECYEDAEDTLEIAKFAVERITRNFDSNKWALQHIAKAQTKVTQSQ